jgi:hypothetical protein
MNGEITEFPREGGPEQLAARATARELLLAMAAQEAPPAAAIDRAELWAYANRAPGGPVSVAVERALRGDPEVMRSYRRMLAMMSVGASERAAAAYAGGPFQRKLKGALVQIVEEDGAPPALLITLDPGTATPRFIEVVALEGCVRRALPAAVEGHIVLDLPRADAELDLLRILLANPDVGVYLIG